MNIIHYLCLGNRFKRKSESKNAICNMDGTSLERPFYEIHEHLFDVIIILFDACLSVPELLQQVLVSC